MNHALQQLIDRFWSGDLSTEQKQALLEQLSQEHPAWMQELEAAYRDSLTGANHAGPSAAYFQTQFEQLTQVIVPSAQPAKGRVWRLLFPRWWQVAAILVVAAGIGSVFYFNQGSAQPEVATQTVGAPQTNSIQTIRFANQTQAATTHFLPDSTELTLEPGAALSYLSTYGQVIRAIELYEGQAFFKVAKDKAHPFRVSAGGVQVHALGTAFRVHKTAKSRVSVLLTEGSVSVHTGLADASFRQGIVLKPGQELIVDLQQSLVKLIEPVTSSLPKNDAVHPKKDKVAAVHVLQFDQQPLNEVFHTIERYYKVKIAFQDEAVSGLWFTGNFRRGDSLSTVLHTLCKLNRLAFRYEGDGYIVSKK